MKILICILVMSSNAFAYSIFSGTSQNLASVEYAAGQAAIQIGDWAAADKVLKTGWLRTADDRRFLPQLASIAYREGKRQTSKAYLRTLLETTPDHRYGNDFLGTLYLLDGNLEAALKYWNRIGKPGIVHVDLQPVPAVNPELMDKAMVIAPAAKLQLKEFLATESRFEVMDVFRRHEFLLRPRTDGNQFDLVLRANMRRGSFSSKYKMATIAAQALFWETIKLDFPNVGGSTITSTSWFSWDDYKHRAGSSFSFPFAGNPHSRIRFFGDARKETWALSAGDLQLSRLESGIEFSESRSSGFIWRSGARVSGRSYDGNDDSQDEFQDGWQVQVFGSSNFSILRVPEQRFVLSSTSTLEAGTFLKDTNVSGSIQQRFDARWFPQPASDDLLTQARLTVGQSFGEIPFDHYFNLGADRFHDLLLRGHRSSIEKKGENPFTRAFVLFNIDFSKQILNRGRLHWRLAPFVDVARIAGSELWNGNRWFLDAGVQSGFRVYGSSELVVTYGKDLRTGRNVVYVGASL